MPPKPKLPTPILSDDDPVLLHVAHLAGAKFNAAGTELEDCNGLTLAELKACCYQARDELVGMQAIQQATIVTADRDGWAKETVVGTDEEELEQDTNSQPVFGTFVLADPDDEIDPWFTEVRFIFGYSYDMHLAAAIFCDMWASALKTQFDFNDGSGNYARSQKYQQVRDTEKSQRSKARVQQVDVSRSDTVAAGAQSLPMSDWFRRLGNG